MKSRRTLGSSAITVPSAAAIVGLVLLGMGFVTGCGSANDTGLTADEIAVAHTPPGGYGADFPAPVLARCTEPLVKGAPDLRGMWQAIAVERGGKPAPSDDPAYRHFQRVEQCGNRIVITAGGVIHDMRADGTEENGVHDVAEFDFRTPIVVVASYENGVHVLRPVGIPGIEVTRQLDGEEMAWHYLGVNLRLKRIGGPESAPPAL